MQERFPIARVASQRHELNDGVSGKCAWGITARSVVYSTQLLAVSFARAMIFYNGVSC